MVATSLTETPSAQWTPHQQVVLRHDLQDRLARCHHPADRVYGELVDDAGLRRDDCRPAEPSRRGRVLFGELDHAHLDIAQLAEHLRQDGGYSRSLEKLMHNKKLGRRHVNEVTVSVH